ncbi:MAG: hypothetical protein JWR26_444 [Pedosphaera sp.]|nr:hypothetical protein [Pedosphaera sp.]
MAPIDTPPKRRGCFFYGCITSLVLLLLIGVIAFLGFRYAVNTANAYILEYTDTTAMSLPKVEMSEADLKKLKDRVAAFNQAVNAGSSAPALSLTSQDINALIANSPETQGLKDKVYVTLDGDKVKGQISLPLDKFMKVPLLKTQGRYLNGEGTFDVTITNSLLWIHLQSMEVKGKPLPANVMAQLHEQNLAESANNDPTNRAALDRFESVQVTNGTAVITPKHHN